MIYRNFKETLFLISVKIHRDQAVDSGHAQHVGHQLGTDRNTGLAFAILSRPTVVGYHCIDGARRSSFGSVHHQQKLHQIVGRGERALYQKDVASSNRLLIANLKLAVREISDAHISELAAQVVADFFGQITSLCAREYFEVTVHCMERVDLWEVSLALGNIISSGSPHIIRQVGAIF